MALSSLTLAAAGAVSSTVGSYYSSMGQKTALGLEADLDEINAQLAESRARDAMARGEREYGASRLQTAALKATQKTAIADAGFDTGFGTSAAILTGTDLLGEVDASTIKANAVREAWGHRLDAVNNRSSARMNRVAAKSINPALNAANTLLTSGAQVAGSYYKLKDAGAFGKNTAKGKSDPARLAYPDYY